MQEKIIEYLKTSEGYLSGEVISQACNISRAAIWKHIEELRRLGYSIEAAPHKGYRVVSDPDKFFPWEMQRNLKTKIIGKKIIYQDEVLSTMDDAFSLGVGGAEEGTVVFAETQTKGRGRRGRDWVSSKGKGVYMSVILRPDASLADASKLTLLAAVAICEAINDVADVEARIKWPNDVLIGGKKISGILTELNAEVDRVKFIVLGIGINVNTTARQLLGVATSLKAETSKNFSRVDVARKVLESLDKWYVLFKQQAFISILNRWQELSMTLGQEITLTDMGGEVKGQAIGLADDGGLFIRQVNGDIVKRMSGDVKVSL